jgi:large subunit ribosomal protein L25
MAEVLNVKIRESRGTSRARRQRAAGQIPAILYGHGKESVSLTVPTEEVVAVVRHGGHLVQLAGDVSDTALVRDVQWDPFGVDVLHIDLARVEAGEKVRLNLAIELKGQAKGTREGGIVSHVRHEVQIDCPVTNIPDKLHVNVNHLALGESITAGQIELPEGASLVTDPELVVVQCVSPMLEPEPVAAPGEAIEPELIGRKAKEEGEEEEEK